MFDPLPIDLVLPKLLTTLRDHASVVLRAPTGAGKTTRVPPALLDASIVPGRIAVLEPRRLAARAAARRMAHERGQRVGDDVGYHVRFDRQVGPRTRVIVMTPGIMLRMLQDDPFLEAFGIVVFDEFHERSLDNDLALGMIRLLQTTVRPELRILVMSATLNTETIAAYLASGTNKPACPIVTSEGRLFPVDIAYEPRSTQDAWPIAAAKTVERVLQGTPGDVLCFLPGMQEIRQATRELQDRLGYDNILILPLHGDLSPEEQDRALQPQSQRRVVLATNVAETSVTVEGITAVVDTGLARMQTFDASVGMDRLELTPIARDAADQRAGRAGRTQPGICVRLWTEASHAHRPERTPPEIFRVDLAGAVLQLLTIGEADVQRFPWLDAPPSDAIDQAMALLRRLGAIGESGLTDLGRAMASLPVHPRLARMLIEGERFGHGPRVALAAALLAERDPFTRGRGESGSPIRRKVDAESDVLERVRALEAYEADGTTTFPVGTLLPQAARFLLRARDQMLRMLRSDAAAMRLNRIEADEAVLRSLLTAFPDRVARRRAGDPTKGVMVGGSGVRLAPWCILSSAELFLAIDVNADPRETLVRQASAIQRDWLTGAIVATIAIDFDEASERLVAVKRWLYEDLLIEETPAALPKSEEASRRLAETGRTRLSRVLPEAESAGGSFLARARWLREQMPDLGLPAFDDAELGDLLPWACADCRSFDEVRRADWLGLLQSKLTPTQVQAVEREAPESVQVPSGSRIALAYESGRSPVLAVRIQEMFGLKETPRIAAGRVRVLLHLLAPNYRPQQVTDDLASFWKNTYPLIRKELRIRYPKHAWPEDPMTAVAESRPQRKK